MPYKARIQSIINKTDNGSSGNEEAGLVNTFDFPRIPRSILKSRSPTNYQFSALTGDVVTSTTSDTTSTSSTTVVVTVVGGELYFDGAVSSPPGFSLADGETIILDQSDATNADYQIYLYADGVSYSDATIANYTGTAGTDGLLTVTYDAAMPMIIQFGDSTGIGSTSTFANDAGILKA